ncbi:MAG TPA: hypothetical protein VK821_13760 [Dehalococcoidia bacterium]|nr:hypothetical protein [Dehalococcoidia bacterium]
MTDIEEEVRVFTNLVEEPDIAADAGVPDIRAGPLSGSQSRVPRVLGQKPQMAVYLTPLLS